jgi:hypothetical protein
MGRLIALGHTGLKTPRIKLWLIAIAFLYIFPNALYFTRHMTRVVSNPNHFYVKTVANISTEVIKVTSPTSRIYFVYSSGTNDESNVFSYLIMPRDSNRECSFIRPPEIPRADTDHWSCSLSLEEFQAKLSSYDFVVLAKTSEEFMDYYASPLKISPDLHTTRIYSVSKGNAAFALSPVTK